MLRQKRLLKLVEEDLENAKENGYDLYNLTDLQLAIDIMDCTDLGNEFSIDEIKEAVSIIRAKDLT